MTTTDISASQPPGPNRDGTLPGAAGKTPEAPIRRPALHPERTARSGGDSWHFELFLAFCSAWVAVQLWFWPDQFPLGGTQVTLSVGLHGHEERWALVCAMAALLKLSGLACRFWSQWTALSAMLMISGLFMSIVIWTIVGATWEFDFPHSLAPIVLIGGALGAAWQLAQWRLPTGPRR